jgi:hypothetical protein
VSDVTAFTSVKGIQRSSVKRGFMDCNVGTIDRLLRAAIAIGAVAFAAFAENFGLRIAICFSAMGLFASALMGFCPAYFLMGIRTTPRIANPIH